MSATRLKRFLAIPKSGEAEFVLSWLLEAGMAGKYLQAVNMIVVMLTEKSDLDEISDRLVAVIEDQKIHLIKPV